MQLYMFPLVQYGPGCIGILINQSRNKLCHWNEHMTLCPVVMGWIFVADHMQADDRKDWLDISFTVENKCKQWYKLIVWLVILRMCLLTSHECLFNLFSHRSNKGLLVTLRPVFRVMPCLAIKHQNPLLQTWLWCYIMLCSFIAL